MCLQINTITTTRKSRITHCRQYNPNNLHTLSMSANTLLSFSIGLWNFQSAVNKADFITSITSHSRLNLMALTETWIKPEDNATPAALSNNFSFSHTPPVWRRGGGTGLLISNNRKFTPLSSPSINSSFESHSVTITHPLKIYFVVVYRPPGPLVNFVEVNILGNYRPVSLLPFIAKTLERVVFNQVTAFLTQNNLLDSNQSGFRSGHSTKTALLSVIEDLRLTRTASKSSLLILLDLSAAFDTVNHQILLSTLLRKGISGTALQWFDSYLSDRSFKVSWRGEVSKSQHLTTGVPQGSVLGPLLFSVNMASPGSVIQKHGFSYPCYADDPQLYLSFHPDDPTIAARISACLADISC